MAARAKRDRYRLKKRPQPGARELRCEDAGCEAYYAPGGWSFRVPLVREDLIREVRESGRKYTVHVGPAEVEFTFPPGTRCFRRHYVDWVEKFGVPNRYGETVRTTPELWVEQFGENQQRLAEIQARG
jgi:hypothetical protein